MVVISSLSGCAEQRPPVECTGKIVVIIFSEECDLLTAIGPGSLVAMMG